VSDDRQFKALQSEVQPELDRMRTEHERIMRLIGQMPEPSEAGKQAIAEMNSPEGWRRAIAEVVADGRPQRSKAKYWVLAGVIAVALMGGVLLVGLLRSYWPSD
jgi:hypothetical protein